MNALYTYRCYFFMLVNDSFFVVAVIRLCDALELDAPRIRLVDHPRLRYEELVLRYLYERVICFEHLVAQIGVAVEFVGLVAFTLGDVENLA